MKPCRPQWPYMIGILCSTIPFGLYCMICIFVLQFALYCIIWFAFLVLRFALDCIAWSAFTVCCVHQNNYGIHLVVCITLMKSSKQRHNLYQHLLIEVTNNRNKVSSKIKTSESGKCSSDPILSPSKTTLQGS